MDKTPQQVLIVDDDQGFCETLTDILSLKGYQVTTAARGQDAINSVREHENCAVALIDLVLPDITGMEVVEQIKGISPLTQVVLITAFSSVDSAVDSLRANVIDYLQKPVDIDYLVATIERAFEHRRRLIAEQMVRKAADEWRLTFDTIPDMIMIVDPEFKIIRANRALADNFGLPFNEILGRKCYELVHESSAPPEECPLKRTIADGKLHSYETHIDRLGKDVIHTTTPLAGPDGDLGGAVVVMHDITERKAMELKVLQSEKLAAVGQIAAGVAHEINNPLAFVMTNLGQLGKYCSALQAMIVNTGKRVQSSGYPELIDEVLKLEKELDLDYIRKDTDELIEESIDGLVRIRNIVADLRKFSHMGEEDVEIVDLNAVVNSAINMAKSEIKLRGRLETQLAGVSGVPGIWGRLAQAVLNILINAAHALDPARFEENVIRVVTDEKDGQVFIRISDTGRGMSPQILKKIFDPFFTTKKAGEGTGLGLAICQDIIRRHRGEITVESEPGQGSTFEIRIPVETGLLAAPVLAKPAEPSGAETRGSRILVVDDEKQVLKALKRTLEPQFRLTLADSALSALKALDLDSCYDLILCDLVMPGHDGRFLYQEATARWPELEPRFIFFTGGAYGDSLKAFALEMSERTIQKPVRSEVVISIINHKLKEIRAPEKDGR